MFMIDCSVNMAANPKKLRHKHLKLDQEKLDRARRFLRVRTEQETVEKALDMILHEERIKKALVKVRAIGGVRNVFGD